MRRALVAVLMLASTATAQPPKAVGDFSRGKAMLSAYMRHQTETISSACLSVLTTREAWEQQRPELRRQFLEMMGLWPMPAKTDLKPRVTGTVEGQGYIVEKLVFESAPGLYVPAHVYRPKNSKNEKLPAILYVCGHGNVVENGVWYGSKANYQYHPAWFATHGYVCIILDTLQLSEIPGKHHGTHNLKMWWWQARGYTPAGVELWNAIRAIDYLETRPDVDKSRIGVTGRSGGGATSWWIAAADERIQAAVPVAGIADLESHIVEAPGERFKDGVISGHCDCMYPINSYRWDFAMIAALIAPRPLLLGNSDEDSIFPVMGYRRLAEKVRKVYRLYDADIKFQLLETQGPHKDTPELRIGINKWMNRWLKKDSTIPVEDDLPPRLTPAQLKVLAKTPEDARNDVIHETFVPMASIVVPNSAAEAKKWWQKKQPELVNALRTQVFSGWTQDPPPLNSVLVCDTIRDGLRFRAIDFTSEEKISLRLFVVTSSTIETPKKVVLSVLDEQGWKEWSRDLGAGFQEFLQLTSKSTPPNAAKQAQHQATLRSEQVAFAAICPRGVGPTRWAEPGSVDDTHARRRFPLIGQTLEGQQVWDVRRAVQVIPSIVGWQTAPIRLHGEGETAGLALFAGIFESKVSELDLWHPPASYRESPIFLNLARVLDVPQALALASPRPVTVWLKTDKEQAAWNWTIGLQKKLALETITIKLDR